MPGIQLNLTVNVLDIATCSPIENAAIDIWHCDASGVYSWFVNEQNPAPVNSTFLRGIVLTDSYGSSTFKTIYPGWYIGRATHIHVKVHINGSDTNGCKYFMWISLNFRSVHRRKRFIDFSIFL